MIDTDTRPIATPITRRRFLQGSALAGVGTFLAACAGAGSTVPPGSSPGTTPATGTPTGGPTPTGPLNWANWDAYIDVEDDGVTSPTIEEFEAEYGIEVNYANAQIEDNNTFVATIRPQLEAGVDTGWDLVILTDWMAAKIIAAGWAEPIDPAHVPDAVANLRDELKGMPWDPDQEHHYPYQSGAVGVGYNRVSTGRDLTKVADLFDPAFAGKVTLLTEVRDTFPLIHLMLQAQGQASGTPASEMTAEDAKVVHDFLKPYVDTGHIRAFTGNEYLSDFGGGDTWAAMVWSGDLASSAGPDDVFAYPEEGSMRFNDNMLIPKGAKNKYSAELMINWVYDVDRAARIAAWVYYISPVNGVDEAIRELDPDAADNPLLFPPDDVLAKQHDEPAWSDEDEEREINELFASLTGA